MRDFSLWLCLYFTSTRHIRWKCNMFSVVENELAEKQAGFWDGELVNWLAAWLIVWVCGCFIK